MWIRGNIILGSLCLLITAGCSQSSSPAQSEEAATTVLAEFGRFHQPLEGWSVTSRLEVRLRDAAGADLADFEPMVQTRTIQVAPARFAIRSEDGMTVSSDGEHAYMSSTVTGRYYRGNPLPEPVQLRETPIASLFGGPENLRILLLTDEDPIAVIRNAGESADYVGRETLDGKPAHHLRVARGDEDQASLTDSATTEIWIAAEGDPLLLKTVRSTPPRPLQLPGGAIEAATVETEVFQDWSLNAAFGADAFQVSSTELRRVASLPAVFEEPPRLLGQPAPDIDLVPIAGDTQRLSSLQGQVVLLDFWASWCGPCRDELPIVARLEQEYADRGVVLYAVNLGDTLNEIHDVMRGELADVKVALDPDNSIAPLYDVGGIPHLAVVGPDGRVQAVHVGVGSDTEAVLREEIEALLAGVDLANDGLPD
jgi:thiol-disulfide isomerase/thioredoxin